MRNYVAPFAQHLCLCKSWFSAMYMAAQVLEIMTIEMRAISVWLQWGKINCWSSIYSSFAERHFALNVSKGYTRPSLRYLVDSSNLSCPKPHYWRLFSPICLYTGFFMFINEITDLPGSLAMKEGSLWFIPFSYPSHLNSQPVTQTS